MKIDINTTNGHPYSYKVDGIDTDADRVIEILLMNIVDRDQEEENEAYGKVVIAQA